MVIWLAIVSPTLYRKMNNRIAIAKSRVKYSLNFALLDKAGLSVKILHERINVPLFININIGFV